MELLMQYSWPGNIRELINSIEYAFVLCPGGQIQKKHLPSHLRQRQEMSPSSSVPKQVQGDFNKTRRHKLIEALEQTGGNQTRAARILGVSRVTVWKWIKKYGIRLDARVHSK
jgi:transcriptional regulator of acetoin/glycerol metabolism